MRAARSRPLRLRRTICWPVLALLPLAAAAQLPGGGRVVAGEAAIDASSAAQVRVLQSTPRAVLRWDSFNIGAGNSVVFKQPHGTGAAILNIVGGDVASTLAGSLRADGSVLLVNPHGVFITPTGTVDVGSTFIASTLAIRESDFMVGRLAFEGHGGRVLNQGTIRTGAGGVAALLGSVVANEGLIRAPLGRVALGSAYKATLDLSGDGFLQVLAPAEVAADAGQALVTQAGTIEADGGVVAIKAATVREAVREAVHMPGEVRARSVSGRDGAIVFDGGAGGNVRVSGLADASAGVGAARGGRIDVTGTSVLLQGATLDASGAEQGGLVRVGGAFQGGRAPADPDSAQTRAFVGRHAAGALANAQTTTIDAASRIDVSATGAQGSGGTAIVWSDHSTRADGEIAATGAVSAGAVEVSAGSHVQSVALRRIRLGRGGQLLLDPRNIEIGSGSGPEAGTTYLVEADIAATLAAGTDVSLLASNDIGWFDAFTQITPAAGARAGNLRLAAGRSVSLSGTFNTGLGDWTIVANERAANGVDPSLREAGGATIDLGNAQFINSNGKLTLTLADGAGNGGGLADGSAGGVDRIRIGHFSGDSLAAQVAPGAVHADGDRVQVQFFGNVNAANAITIDGDILNAVSELTLSGSSVNWTAEKTGGRLTGEMGSIRFVENGVTTRFGRAGTDDATRLNLAGPAGLSRVYGDADPGQAALGGQALALAAHNAQAPADDLSQVLAPGSLAVTGPGVAAGVGNHILQIGAGASIALKPLEYDADFNVVGGATGAYFIDLTPATAGLGITPRPLTAAVLNPGYTYGSPAAAATLSGVVNGDAVGLTASIGGASVTLAPLAGGLGFAPRLGAGSHGYTLTGLAGAGSANYTLDLGGVPAGTVTVAPKPITYAGGSAQQTYGTATYSPALQGVLPGDDVMPGGQSMTTITAGTAGGSNALPVGSYDIGLTGLAGADQSNYVLAAGGHTPLRLTITPKPLTWQVAADIDSTYGTLASGMAATLYGLLADDLVSPLFVASGLPIGARTPAGYHPLAVGGLAGTGSGNYQLAATGNTAALLRVAPKPLTFGGSDSTQVYGLNTVAAPVLQGVEAGDQVTPVVAIVGGSTSTGQGGSGVLSVGHYITSVSALAGSDAGNYTLAATGNVNPTTAITPAADLRTCRGLVGHHLRHRRRAASADAVGPRSGRRDRRHHRRLPGRQRQRHRRAHARRQLYLGRGCAHRHRCRQLHAGGQRPHGRLPGDREEAHHVAGGSRQRGVRRRPVEHDPAGRRAGRRLRAAAAVGLDGGRHPRFAPLGRQRLHGAGVRPGRRGRRQLRAAGRRQPGRQPVHHAAAGHFPGRERGFGLWHLGHARGGDPAQPGRGRPPDPHAGLRRRRQRCRPGRAHAGGDLPAARGHPGLRQLRRHRRHTGNADDRAQARVGHRAGRQLGLRHLRRAGRRHGVGPARRRRCRRGAHHLPGLRRALGATRCGRLPRPAPGRAGRRRRGQLHDHAGPLGQPARVAQARHLLDRAAELVPAARPRCGPDVRRAVRRQLARRRQSRRRAAGRQQLGGYGVERTVDQGLVGGPDRRGRLRMVRQRAGRITGGQLRPRSRRPQQRPPAHRAAPAADRAEGEPRLGNAG